VKNSVNILLVKINKKENHEAQK